MLDVMNTIGQSSFCLRSVRAISSPVAACVADFVVRQIAVEQQQVVSGVFQLSMKDSASAKSHAFLPISRVRLKYSAHMTAISWRSAAWSSTMAMRIVHLP
ncbi:MAG: hypothetical protein ACLUAM_06040 [Bifidobacterium adolescentis]